MSPSFPEVPILQFLIENQANSYLMVSIITEQREVYFKINTVFISSDFVLIDS